MEDKLIEIIISKTGEISLDLQNIPPEEHGITKGLEEALGKIIEKKYKDEDRSIKIEEKNQIKNFHTILLC